MALSARTKVAPPAHGTVTRRAGSRRYVYKVVRSYRNDKGQPTNTRRMIGRLDEDTGLLVPNDAYWELYGEKAVGVEQLPAPDSVRSVGAAYAVGGVLERLGAADAVRAALGGERARLALAVACYMARRGNVMDGLPDWCETSTPRGEVIEPAQASHLFSSITHPEKMAFFKLWASRQPPGSHLAYDVTSFSTHAQGIDDAEWGHNRDGDKRPQINLGCYLNQSNALPVFYVTYPGSIVDVSHLPYMTAYNQDLGIGDVTFIMDRGFASTKNLACLRERHIKHIIGAETRLKTVQAAIDQVSGSLVSMRRRLPGGVYAQATEGTVLGQTETLHVYHDPVLAEDRRSELARRIEAEAEQLSRLSHLTARQAAHYRRHFEIQLADDGTFAYEPDPAKADQACRYAGYFALLTDSVQDPSQALDAYRRRDAIEKAFDDVKNHTDMRRLRTHNDDTTSGKLFCAFLALIALSFIQDKIG
ncbi:MAG: transposase, partial [Bifidobacteriaceae bacterium]|nr:transposase [Bifidobacteriaceae bacterium]